MVILFTARSVDEGWAGRLAGLGRRVPLALLGAGMCWFMFLALKRLQRRSAVRRLAVMACISLPFGVVFSAINSWLMYLLSPSLGQNCYGGPCGLDILTNVTIEYSVNFAVVFLAWRAICVGMLASSEAVAAERRAGIARDEARVAQLRALHDQVNPHFLFNCLNSLGTLVGRDDIDTAGGMITEMGGFLRYGLALDPLVDVDIEDEVEMQRRYLEIERHRFAHRLTYEIFIDEHVRGARVPTLLLQPLVENAIKHDLAKTSAPVLISVQVARSSTDRISIVVQDDAAPGRPAAKEDGGIGLRNVRERLEARFEGEASFESGPRVGSGYRAEIEMPFVRG